MNVGELTRACRVPCRMCRARASEPCRSAGRIDRDDAYRAEHPHRLRRVDAWRKP